MGIPFQRSKIKIQRADSDGSNKSQTDMVSSQAVGGRDNSLFASPFSVFRGLEDFDPTVIPLFIVASSAFPVLLMLKSWVRGVQIPRSAGHVLGNVRINGFSLFINL